MVKKSWCYYAACLVWGWVGADFGWAVIVLGGIVISLVALWLMGDLQIGKPLEAKEVD